MSTARFPTEDLESLAGALDAVEADARELTRGLSEAEGTWRPRPEAWSVAECLDHLATANRVYLAAMEPPAARALREGRRRRRPVRPGFFGGWFARSLEPPARAGSRLPAPRKIKPRVSPPLGDALDAFLREHAAVQAFMRTYADIDLAGVRFPNPFIPGLGFSLASGLYIIEAHERRHLWQARNVRQAFASAAAEGSPRT